MLIDAITLFSFENPPSVHKFIIIVLYHLKTLMDPSMSLTVINDESLFQGE